MEVGKKYVLWLVDFRPGAYKDQAGISHNAYVVLEQIPVEIIETRAVKNMWGKGTNVGYKAVAEDGREFTCNWDSFPDDSMTPTYFWDCFKDNKNDVWQPEDAIQAYRSGIAHVTPEGERAFPVGAIECIKHHNVFLPDDYCFKCEHDL